MIQEVFEIYQRNFPYIVRADETVLQILSNKSNIIEEQRDEQNKLIGVSVINQNTILLLCVDEKYRNKGIGTKLLNKSEDIIKHNGYQDIVIGAGFDYIMPGVPTARRYFPAENEELYQGIDEKASDFFTKRGYIHSWNCNCFDMRLSLNQFKKDSYNIGDIIDNITYRWAVLSDLENICVCVNNAYQEFTGFYQDEKLYDSNSAKRVLIAVFNGEVVGTLIVGPEDNGRHLGCVGCTTVKREYQGRHIAVNLVTIGTKYLKDIGVEEAYLSYTYTGLDHMYGYAGYKIVIYYMMAVKHQCSTGNLTRNIIKKDEARFYYKDENAPKPNKPNHIGTAVIIEYQDKILMEHRTDSEAWAVIGGGLWLNESLAECAIREVFEETGIKLHQEDILFCKIYDDPSRIICYPDGNVLRIISVVYKVKLKNEPELKCSSESKELKFFSKEALKDITIANTHIPIIQDYQNGISIPEESI